MYRFFPISGSMDLKAFSCEEEALTTYLHRYALGNHKKGIATCIVCQNAEDRVVGFYAFSMAQVAKENLPPEAAKGIPNYPIGAIRIGRLARDVSVKRQGVGELLLKDGLRKIAALGRTTDGSVPAFRFVLVDAKNEIAAQFYEKFGFIRFVDKPGALVLPLATVAEAIRGPGA
jgi:ribosomal protein S18 acetylase RimI-like enzyme